MKRVGAAAAAVGEDFTGRTSMGSHLAGCVLCRSSSSTMMRSISWWEMSIVNESSIADPNPSGFTFSSSFGIARVARCADLCGSFGT